MFNVINDTGKCDFYSNLKTIPFSAKMLLQIKLNQRENYSSHKNKIYIQTFSGLFILYTTMDIYVCLTEPQTRNNLSF